MISISLTMSQSGTREREGAGLKTVPESLNSCNQTRVVACQGIFIKLRRVTIFC